MFQIKFSFHTYNTSSAQYIVFPVPTISSFNLNAQSQAVDADDENKDNEKPKQCKDHSTKITCLKCININSGAKIKKLTKDDGQKIYGFE